MLAFFHWTQVHLCGSQTDSSDRSQPPPPPPHNFPRGSENPTQESTLKNPLVQRLWNLTLPDSREARQSRLCLSLRQRLARSTRESNPPTCDRIKKLTEEAKAIVRLQGLPITSETLFIAMLVVVTYQVIWGKSGKSY